MSLLYSFLSSDRSPADIRVLLAWRNCLSRPSSFPCRPPRSSPCIVDADGFPSCLARFSSCVLQVVEVESDTHQIGTSKERLVQERDGALPSLRAAYAFQVREPSYRSVLVFFAFLCPFVDCVLVFSSVLRLQLFKRLVSCRYCFSNSLEPVGIFGSILQTDFRIAVHPFLPYPLLHATYMIRDSLVFSMRSTIP